MISNGYIKLYRKMIDWEWYTDSNTKSLFLHCLLMANHKTRSYKGITIQRGSFVTSRDDLAKQIGFSVQSTRTSLKRLKSTSDITIESTNRGTLISIPKYEQYQSSDGEDNQQINQPSNQQVTSNQPAINQQLTTNKNDKKEKNDKNKDNIGSFNQFIIDYPEYKESLNAYKRMRVDMKKKMQPLAEKRFTNRLKGLIEKGNNGIELVELAIEKNWLSIYEPNSFNKPQTKQDVPDYMTENKKKPDQSEEKRKELLDKLRRKEDE